MSLVRGDRGLIKLDIDAGQKRPTLGDIMVKLSRSGYTVVWMAEKCSPSGKGWHIMLKLTPTPQTAEEVVAIQAMLGSDSMREACNLHRARMLPYVSAYWRDRWNVLYGW